MFIPSPIPALMAQFLRNSSSSSEYEEHKNSVSEDKDKDVLKKTNFSFFGVWVRSSDKQKLIFCQNFILRGLYYNFPVGSSRNPVVIASSDDIILGKYSDYNFALSVLDKLQSCLLSGFGVFEMPVSDIKNSFEEEL